MFRVKQEQLLIAFLFAVVCASAGDIWSDLTHGADVGHLIQEGMLLALGTVLILWLLQQFRGKQAELGRLRCELDEIRRLPVPESQVVVSARQQLGKAISDQYERWNLTTSEREIGLMLLKGYSLKEIAILRGTAEKTIRQQASAIYQKAGVSGRHAFAAWFLEDLL